MIRYLKWAWEVILFFIPRFIDDEVVLNELPGGDYEIICSLIDVKEGELFDGITTVQVFAFMFWAFPYGVKEVDGLEIRPFVVKG